MVELTSADKKILGLIEYNPRITFKELAKACHLSKDAMKYRVARLEKEKIILGYSSFIDYKKLGNQSYKLYLKINGTQEQKEKFRDYLRKQKSVFAIFDLAGTWNIGIALFAKTHQQFNEIENQILENFGDIITERRFCSMIDAEIYHKDFFDSNENNLIIKEFSFWGEIENNKLDELDKKIIKLMHANSRISLVDLAEDLKLSIDAIKNRINRLKKNKIMDIYKTNINYELLGFDQYKLLIYPRIFSNKIEKELINFLKSTNSCIDIVRTIGPWKIEAEFCVKKSQEVEEIISKINEKFKGNVLDFELSVMRNQEMFACKDLLLD